jgi:tetratricopeptide (TPR) repeat protein
MNQQTERFGRDVGQADHANAAQASAGNGSNDIGVGPGDDPLHTSSNGAGEAIAPEVEAERVRLDDAMRRADELLVDSLRRDEDRRQRRRRLRNITLILGGLMTTAFVCVLLGLLAGQGKTDSADAQKAQALSQEGWQLWQQRKLPEAEAKFAEAVKLDPQNANAYNGLGWAQFNQGKDEAVKAFEKVVALEPDHAAGLNGLGQYYLQKNELDKAEKYLLQAASNEASAAWYGLARLYLMKNDFDRALPWALLVAREPGADEGARKMLDAARERKLDARTKKMLGITEPAKK